MDDLKRKKDESDKTDFDEQSLLATLLCDGGDAVIRHCESIGMTGDDFEGIENGIIYTALCDVHTKGSNDEGDDLSTRLLLSLRASGKDSEAGGLGKIYEILEHAETSTHGRYFADRVAQRAARRMALRKARLAVEQLDEDSSDPAAVFAELAAFAPSLTRVSNKIHAFNGCKFDPSKRPDKPAPIITLGGVPVLTHGGLATIQGAEKSGKSHICAAIARACLGLGGSLGVDCESPGAVAYIDAEQSAFDFWQLAHRAAGSAPNFHAYHATGKKPSEILAIVKAICESVDDLRLVLIDGFADLVTDVNDTEQANSLIASLMTLAGKHSIGICGVIHLNPGAEFKTRGNLGSQLSRKCETTIQIDGEKDGETKVIYTAQARHQPLPKSKGIRFAWDNEAKGFVVIEGTPAEINLASKVEEWTRTLQDIQAQTGMLAWTHGDLTKAIETAENCSNRTARNRLKPWLDSGLLRHDGARGIYTSNLEVGQK